MTTSAMPAETPVRAMPPRKIIQAGTRIGTPWFKVSAGRACSHGAGQENLEGPGFSPVAQEQGNLAPTAGKFAAMRDHVERQRAALPGSDGITTAIPIVPAGELRTLCIR